jgi:hypothetical protein
MNPKAYRLECGEVSGEVSGRIGDYSRDSAIFVGVYQRESESTKRVFVYVMIDKANEWSAPSPKFTSSGGMSPEVLHHLRHIFYKYQTDSQKKVVFTDENGGRLYFLLSSGADILIETEDADLELGAVVSFKEDHHLCQDLLLLWNLINGENLRNPTRNPFSNSSVREHLKLINVFP